MWADSVRLTYFQKKLVTTVIVILINILMFYSIYVYFLQNNISNVTTYNLQIYTLQELYSQSVINYNNLQQNIYDLSYFQDKRLIVHYNYLPYTLVNINNLLLYNNIQVTQFSILSRIHLADDIFIAELTVGGIGKHNSIMAYLYSLNNTSNIVFIDDILILNNYITYGNENILSQFIATISVPHIFY